MNNRYRDIIKHLSDKELMFHLYTTQFIILMISLLLGFFIYHDVLFITNLMNWNDLRILTIGGVAGLVVVNIDIILTKRLPKSFYDDGGLNERIFANKSYLQIAFIALLVAFCEELLFRGIIQTQFGLFIASLVFAFVHFRYLYNWFLFLNIIFLSFVIGLIYLYTNNLAVTFTMHFVIDCVLGIYLKNTVKKSEWK
ncbi:lysostaphin resistance A-like protein [Pseudoneobacillus sp. C159]